MTESRQLPPPGIRAILPTFWKAPAVNTPFGEVELEATRAQACRLYEAGHRVFITTAGSGSGYDVSVRQVISVARSVSEELSARENVWIYVGCVAGLERCREVAIGVRDLNNVRGLLILPNRHPHGDPKGSGWIDFYQMLSPILQMPYMIYHVQAGVTVTQYRQLAEDQNFVELKWALASPDGLGDLRQAVEALSSRVNVVCGLGDKNGPRWVRDYDVRGWTSYTVNCAPYLCKEIERASLASETARVQLLEPPVLAFEDLRFGENVCFNNRLVVAALLGREAFLRPPHRRYDDQEWAEAELAIQQLAAAESRARIRAEAASRKVTSCS